MYRRYGSLSSSVDPEKLATSVVGILKFAAGAATLLGYNAVVGDINSLAEQAGQFTLAAFALWGLAESMFGLARKVVVAFSAQ